MKSPRSMSECLFHVDNKVLLVWVGKKVERELCGSWNNPMLVLRPKDP
jgi:hypothetical protein